MSSPRGCVSEAYLDPRKHFFRPEEILGGMNSDIDPDNKEQYLEDKEFERIFGMAKNDFNRMALWKRQNMKAKIGWAGSGDASNRRASLTAPGATARKQSHADAFLGIETPANLTAPSPVFGNRK